MAKLTVIDKNGCKVTSNIEPDAPMKTLMGHLLSHHQDHLFQCQGNGICERCQHRVLEGSVKIVQEAMRDQPKGHALSCCTVPAPGKDVTVQLSKSSFRNQDKKPASALSDNAIPTQVVQKP